MARFRTTAELLGVLSLLAPTAAWAATTTRDSVAAGVQANGGSLGSALSGDGRFVAFASNATNLVEGDTNNTTDIFLRDRFTGAVRRISVSSSGAQANGESVDPTISANGRFVAFESAASNLVSGDSGAFRDIFLRDTVANATTRVSISTAGVQGNLGSSKPSISAGGSRIVFQSSATNLVGGDGNGKPDIFLRDRTAGTTTRVSNLPSGAEPGIDSQSPAISGDGRFFAFVGLDQRYVPSDTHHADVYVRELGSLAITKAVPANVNASSSDAALSSDARYVAFTSGASNLGDGDANSRADVYRLDRTNQTLSRLSDGNGVQGDGNSALPAISGDGRFVAFRSSATNLVASDSNGAADVFLRDTATFLTTLVSADPAGGVGNDRSATLPGTGPSISADGRFVTFESKASNLVANDTNGVGDIFTFDRLSPTPASVVRSSGSGLSIVDGAHDISNFAVSSAGGVLNVSPLGITALPLTIGNGCQAASSGGGATCAVSGSTLVRAELGDEKDFFNHGGCAPELGDATVFGGTGDDVLVGGPGFDLLSGGADFDMLAGCGGNDRLEGGDGNDLLKADTGGDVLIGGAGVDRADYSASAVGVNVTLDDIANDGVTGEADNVMTDVENVTGTGVADNLTGSGVRNQFSGGGGNDVLTGGSEPVPTNALTFRACNRFIGGRTGTVLSVCGDTLIGDDGDDSLHGQGDDDFLVGGLGADRFNGGDNDDIISSRDGVQDIDINCNAGSDTAVVDLRDFDAGIIDSDCETVAASDRREGPNVSILVDRPLRLRGGRLLVKLSCPRALRRPCRGRLRAAGVLGQVRRAPENRYRVRAGRSRTLRIRVGQGVRRGGRAFLQSVEKGDVNGLKTTRTVARVA